MSGLRDSLLLVKATYFRDTESFAIIYDTYVDAIYRFIYFKVSSTEDAQDLTSQTFLKAWEYLQVKGREVTNIRALLYRIARMTVIDFYRTRTRTAEYETDLPDTITDESDDVPDTQEEIGTSFDREALQQALLKIKDEYREVLVMLYLDELSTREVADALEITPANVRQRAHRGLRVLRSLLNTQ